MNHKHDDESEKRKAEVPLVGDYVSADIPMADSFQVMRCGDTSHAHIVLFDEHDNPIAQFTVGPAKRREHRAQLRGHLCRAESAMSNFWIVSSHDFLLHKTPDSALAEAARLADLTGKSFRVYQVTDKLVPGIAPDREKCRAYVPIHSSKACD